MHIEDSLSLIALAKDFKVTAHGNNCFTVEDEEHNLEAVYEEGEWSYHVTGVYNSGSDRAKVNIEILRGAGLKPWRLIDKKDPYQKALARWCNNKFIFKSCPRFEDYEGAKKLAERSE